MKTEKERDHRDEFRAAVSDVRPLKPDNRLPPQTSKPKPRPEQRRRDEQAVLHELLHPVEDPAELETGEELLYLRPGYSPRLLRRLRRGHFSTADSIDLHHLGVDVAREILVQFLADAERRHFGCVRIVHGKGLRSRGLPKLKLMTRHILQKHPGVIAFASCRPLDGGTGAVQVLLKTTRKKAR